MSKQPEALRLAKWLLDNYEADGIDASAVELRRQHALIEEMSKALQEAIEVYDCTGHGKSEGALMCRAALAKAEAQQ